MLFCENVFALGGMPVNGRVLGYNYAHGFHHRHRMGCVDNMNFIRFEDIEARIEREWLAIGGTQ